MRYYKEYLPGCKGTSFVLLSSFFIPRGNMESGKAGAKILSQNI